MTYSPEPIDTTDVELGEDILKLSELLAKNAHEVWAEMRVQDGWVFGPERDDANKTHPCLVPYEELPESEKEYDRSTSIETLKAIKGLGFKIQKEK